MKLGGQSCNSETSWVGRVKTLISGTIVGAIWFVQGRIGRSQATNVVSSVMYNWSMRPRQSMNGTMRRMFMRLVEPGRHIGV